MNAGRVAVGMKVVGGAVVTGWSLTGLVGRLAGQLPLVRAPQCQFSAFASWTTSTYWARTRGKVVFHPATDLYT